MLLSAGIFAAREETTDDEDEDDDEDEREPGTGNTEPGGRRNGR